MRQLYFGALFMFLSMGAFAQSGITKDVLKESLFFELGKADLTDNHKSKIDSILLFLKYTNGFKIGIKGYACNIGTTEVNKKVSNQRALNTFNYLIEKGIQKDSLFYAGLGLQDPLGDNTTEEGRKKNRRTDIEVEFKIVAKKDTPKPVVTAPVVKKADTSKFGPDVTTASFKKDSYNVIDATNCIQVVIPDATFQTKGNELLEFSIKDYSKNYDIVKRGMHTFSGDKTLLMLAAVQLGVSVGTEDIDVSDNKYLIVKIPGEYDPKIKVYKNSRNWQLDSTSELFYDYAKRLYVVKLKSIKETISLQRETYEDGMIVAKIKAKNKDQVRPYVMYDNCLIAAGKNVKGKYYSFPYYSKSGHNFRAFYQVFGENTPKSYFLSTDVKTFSSENSGKKTILEKDYFLLKSPSKLTYTESEINRSSMCETPCK